MTPEDEEILRDARKGYLNKIIDPTRPIILTVYSASSYSNEQQRGQGYAIVIPLEPGRFGEFIIGLEISGWVYKPHDNGYIFIPWPAAYYTIEYSDQQPGDAHAAPTMSSTDFSFSPSGPTNISDVHID